MASVLKKQFWRRNMTAVTQKIEGILSNKITGLQLPVFRKIAPLVKHYDAIDLAGGVPDFSAPACVKEAAIKAIQEGCNQYALMQGNEELRTEISKKIYKKHGVHYNPETEITVCCGATEAMAATLLAILNPGDEVIIIEPAFTIYGPDVELFGGKPVYVSLTFPAFRINKKEIESAITNKTKAIIFNSPHNPTGRIFDQEEVDSIVDICKRYNLLVITDEIYDEICFDNRPLPRIWLQPEMENQVIVINGFSKTYSVTGWRLGYIIAPDWLTEGIRMAHNYLTISSPAPLQQGIIQGVTAPAAYYEDLRKDYTERRNYLTNAFRNIGIPFLKSQGGYFLLADFSYLGWKNDVEFVKELIAKLGVAAVPLSGFYHIYSAESVWLRFAFCKKLSTLRDAVERLQGIEKLRKI